jgi:hypothetical protein
MLLLSGFVFAVAVHGADRADAASLRQSRGGAELVVLIGARKGTRNFDPSKAGALALPRDTETVPKRDSLEGCIANWDAGTHITPSKWREICERQIMERGAHSGSAAQSEP